MSDEARPLHAMRDSRACPDDRDGKRCARAPAEGFNPLARCPEHLVAYRARSGSDLAIGDSPGVPIAMYVDLQRELVQVRLRALAADA